MSHPKAIVALYILTILIMILALVCTTMANFYAVRQLGQGGAVICTAVTVALVIGFISLMIGLLYRESVNDHLKSEAERQIGGRSAR